MAHHTDLIATIAVGLSAALISITLNPLRFRASAPARVSGGRSWMASCVMCDA